MIYAKINNDTNTIVGFREEVADWVAPEHKFGVQFAHRFVPVILLPIPEYDPASQMLAGTIDVVSLSSVERQYIVKSLLPPQEIPLWAFRSILTIQGFASQIDDLLDSLPEPNKTVAKTQWVYGNYIQRNHPLISQLGTVLGLTSDDIDNIFKQAAALS